METSKKTGAEYPEIEGCQYITQKDEVTPTKSETGEIEDRYVTRTLYMRDDSTFFIKTRQWLPWWGTEPLDLGDEDLADAEAALAWATNVAGLNPIMAARLIVGTDTTDTDE